MANLDRRITILLYIQSYCNETIKALNFFGENYETFKNNPIFRNSVSMPVFQIGELVKNLSKDYPDYIKETSNDIPWKDIIRMREKFAHHYGEMNDELIFDTAVNDIPQLKKFVSKWIKELKK